MCNAVLMTSPPPSLWRMVFSSVGITQDRTIQCFFNSSVKGAGGTKFLLHWMIIRIWAPQCRYLKKISCAIQRG